MLLTLHNPMHVSIEVPSSHLTITIYHWRAMHRMERVSLCAWRKMGGCPCVPGGAAVAAVAEVTVVRPAYGHSKTM
jgi:hypothetical protein